MSSEAPIEVRGRAGEPIALPVGSTAATGHEWQLDLPDGVLLVGETAGEAVSPGSTAGAATGSHLLVSAPVGRYDLVARLARPWEPEPVRVVHITLIVS